MRIYVATHAEIPHMHRIRMSVRENRLSDQTRVRAHDYMAFVERDGRAWVAEVDGRIVGFAVADLARSNVWALFVEPGYEGHGIGRQLHDRMMDWLFGSGATLVWLRTDPDTRAERFYRAAGWRYVGQEEHGEARFEMANDQGGRARHPRDLEDGARGRAAV